MDKIHQLIKELYTGNEMWYKLPYELRENANTKNINSSIDKEMYYTTEDNKEIGEYASANDINIVIVGRYEWDYYYDEDSYDIREGHFLSLARLTTIPDRLNSEDVYTILDQEMEPTRVASDKLVSLALVFDKAKKRALNISSFIDDFLGN